jgi:hypothetical protein
MNAKETKAYSIGYDDCQYGMGINRNPFQVLTLEWKAYRDGWIHYKVEILLPDRLDSAQ